ncbi:MAG: hypothetical protein WCW43_03675, partial [Candidatus Paceibacterota bacterium]
MKIQKITLSLIFITLFLFIFTQSASAATCGRVDYNGDYWYQCNNNQITKTAVTFFNDRISNFATTTTTVSWNFYDGLTHATTSYSNLLPPYNFGGTYTNEILTVINPLTSTYSCPTGYTAYQFIAYGRRNDYNNYYCLANQNIPSLVNFGGMYATDNRDSSVISNNPITGNATCPSGYISQAFGRSENNYETGYYCYATSSSVVPVSKFGGLYIPTCVNEDFKNIVTNNYSCPYNFSDAEVFKTSCNGVHLCYQRCDGVQDVNLTISSNTQNYDLFTAAGSPTCPVNVNLTINSGIVVSSATTSKAAIYGSSNLPTGSTVNIINNGTIHGKGGKGGDGQYPIAWYQAGAASPILNSMIEGEPGKSGSDAISIIADTKIFNSAGKILSGGGGGGGGKVIVGSYCSGSAGGNGGSGGAGGGAGGIWNRPYNFVGMNGNNGTSGTGGTGGAGTLTMCMSGWGMGSYGGKGGNYGENGQNGGGYSTFYYDGTTVQHGSFYPCDFGFNSSSCNAGGSAGKSINNVDNFSLCVNGKTPETVKGDILGTYDTNCNVCGTIQTKNLTISSNTQNYDLFIAAGSPSCPVNVNLTINSGIVVSSATTSKAAIYGSSNLPTGSTVNIINNGTIHGKGGKGGPISISNVKGYDGSNAVSLIASTTINNLNGYVLGGGGGGGAGSNSNTG